MTKNSQNTTQKEQKNQKFDFSELDLVIRRWAALSGHEKDQSYYVKLKEQYE
jgi:hypothetical protein